MKILLTGLFLSLCSHLSMTQSPTWHSLSVSEKEIVQVVIDVFDGMRAGDSAAVKRHFYPQLSANTAFTSEQGKKELKVDDISQWFDAIARPHDQVWDERMGLPGTDRR